MRAAKAFQEAGAGRCTRQTEAPLAYQRLSGTAGRTELRPVNEQGAVAKQSKSFDRPFTKGRGLLGQRPDPHGFHLR